MRTTRPDGPPAADPSAGDRHRAAFGEDVCAPSTEDFLPDVPPAGDSYGALLAAGSP